MSIEKKTAEYGTAILALLAPIILGTLWIGSVSDTAKAADQQVRELKADLKQVPTDVAVLKTQVAQLSADQKAQYEALLAAIRAVKSGTR
jgi:outer membrane murein-binding lipoprotein Lpp